MKHFMELSDTEVLMGFVASCIERVSQKVGKHYSDVVDVMVQSDVIKSFIIPCYDTLHTQSWDYVVEDVIEYMTNRGYKL